MKRSLHNLAKASFDVLVIGGGIHGAAIARQAACSGFTTALIDKADFSGGSSANSLKIMHGGLRYLPRLEFQRTFESVREQESWLRSAPHLAAPQMFMSPTYNRSLLRSRSLMSVAIHANNIMTHRCRRIPDPARQLPAGRIIGRQESRAIAPQLLGTNITGGAIWSDICLYDSERLVISMLKDAVSEGAVVANYVSADQLLIEKGNRVIGVKAVDERSGDVFDIRARMTIQATGAWVDHLLQETSAATAPQPMGLAMNFLIRNFPVGDMALGLFSHNVNRHLFFVPWRGVVMAGTWYRSCCSAFDSLDVTEADIARGLDALNACFPAPCIQPDDIVAIHAGLLPAQDHVSAGCEPTFLRRYRIMDHAQANGLHGCITALGIKYSTARSVAAQTIALASQYLQQPARDTTLYRPVWGGDIPDINAFLRETAAACPHLEHSVLAHLVKLFGTDITGIIRDAGGADAHQHDIWDAVARFCIRDEMPASLGDLAFRRTGLASAGIVRQEVLLRYAKIMAAEKNWSDNRLHQEVQHVLQAPHLWRAGIAQGREV